MKKLALIAVLFFAVCVWASQTPTASGTAKETPQHQPQTVSTHNTALPTHQPKHYLFHPERYAVAFLPLIRGEKSFAFLVSPTGQAVRIPMVQIGQAFKSGYRPFTVADWLAVTNSVAEEETNLQ